MNDFLLDRPYSSIFIHKAEPYFLDNKRAAPRSKLVRRPEFYIDSFYLKFIPLSLIISEIYKE